MAPARKKISRDNKENVAVPSRQQRTRTAPVGLSEEKANLPIIQKLRRSRRSRRPLSRLDDNAMAPLSEASVPPCYDAQNYLYENSPDYLLPELDLCSLPIDISTEILPEENYPCSPLIDPFCDLHTLFRDSEARSKQPPASPFFLIPYFVEGQVRLVPLQSSTLPRRQRPTLTGLKTRLTPFSDPFLSDALLDEPLPFDSEIVDPFEEVVKMSPGAFCINIGFAVPDERGYDLAL
ncbi:uncharacterized protein EV420DRAFT_1149655 [Desarmillaria tabescens]|uniref:Uncharacterized protein n=1 Tax=Armillaria tabescens TaxID=1929756 RepID=A0AA39NCA0_ARMTA|nr:uncharacterized protein EV420DRAFT_1149655 [Desarmillaria tabescens]KAK0463008.1 hypothetical protein EV420DRAFT_1149655 [Desarmillaria tabescens]